MKKEVESPVLTKKEQHYINRHRQKRKIQNIAGHIVFILMFLGVNCFYLYLRSLSKSEMEKPLIISVLIFINIVFIAGFYLLVRFASSNAGIQEKLILSRMTGIFTSDYDDAGNKLDYFIDSAKVIIPFKLIKHFKNGEPVTVELVFLSKAGTKGFPSSCEALVLSVNDRYYYDKSREK